MTNLRSTDGAVLHLPGRAPGGRSGPRWSAVALRSARRRALRDRPEVGATVPPVDPPVVVLLLHGGVGEPDRRPVPAWWPPVLRLIAVGPAVRHPSRSAVITRLRFRARGWNAGGAEPVADARWAVGQLQHRHPGSPIVLVGHSLGGRVGASVLAEPGVIGLVGLAAWLPPGEPAPDLRERRVILLHGSVDRDVPAAWARDWSARAAGLAGDGRVSYVELPGAGHAMVRQWRRWHRRTARAVATIVAEHPPAG